MTIKVLIVDPDISFIIPIKQALEDMGDYAVSGFANAQAAAEQASRERYDIAVLDSQVDDPDLPDLIKLLRFSQAGLPILVSDTTDRVKQLGTLNVQAVINKPYYARQLAPLIHSIILPTRPNAPVKTPEPPVQPDDTFHRLVTAISSDDTSKRQSMEQLDQVLQTISLSEPPIPADATIRDLVSGSTPPHADQPPQNVPELPPEPDDPITLESDAAADLAVTTLSIAVDPTVPLHQLSLQEFIEQVKVYGNPTVPVEALKTIDEPSFVNQVVDSTLPTTPMKLLRVEETQIGQPIAEQSEPEPEPAQPTSPESWMDTIQQPELPPVEPQEPAPTPPPPASVTPIVELAVQLTQLSVHLTAQATLLMQGDELRASAGPLAQEALGGAVEQIILAWQSAEGEANTLIRYIYLPVAGDFLLYSTRTVENMTLTMLFPADTPIKVIRKQAVQLMNALESVPEPPPQAEPEESEAARTLPSRPTDLKPPEGLREAVAEQSAPEPPPEAPLPKIEGPYAAYSFVWLPREDTLSPEVADHLVDWLSRIAGSHAWQIEGTEIQPGYVSVQISIPANQSATDTVETLMWLTSGRTEGNQLWADAYYIVAPGRPVTQQEIANFLEYQRESKGAA